MKTGKYLGLIVVCLLGAMVRAGIAEVNFCSQRNRTTQGGEEISYTVFYSVAGAYVPAGSAVFTNRIEQFNSRTVYHVTGLGRSNSKYDWIYKVRDRYESYIDTATMQPLRFVRNIQEGNTKRYENISFNRTINTAITDKGVFKTPACIQDVLSTIYYARNLDVSSFKVNDKIPFQMFLENEIHNLYLRYLGREEIRTRFGRFSAIKFKALLLKGTIFQGGEDMSVWVSDDGNRIPLRIEAPVLIGTLKVDMTGYRNLRHILSSLKKTR